MLLVKRVSHQDTLMICLCNDDYYSLILYTKVNAPARATVPKHVMHTSQGPSEKYCHVPVPLKIPFSKKNDPVPT